MSENNDKQNCDVSNNKIKLNPIENNKTIKKKRCFHCNKKSLYVSMCKCGEVFCLNHNQPETHNCSFNYKLNKVMLEPILCQKVESI